MTNGRLALLMAAAGSLMAYGIWSGDVTLPFYPHRDAAPADDAVPAPVPAGAASSVAALNPLAALKPEDFNAIVERPLFNPTRRPAPPPQPVVQPVEAEQPSEPPPTEASQPDVKPEDFTLLGITSVDGTATALVRWNPTNQIYHAKQDQLVSDWHLRSIGALDVTLERDGQTLQLKLFQTFGTAAPPPAQGLQDPSVMQPAPDDRPAQQPPPQQPQSDQN